MGSMKESSFLLVNVENNHKYCSSEEDNKGTDSTKHRASFEDKLCLVILALGSCFTYAGTSVLAPFFPPIAEDKGASKTVIGIIFSSFALTLFLFSPLFGNYMTKIGSKTLIFTGVFVHGLSTISFGLLDMVPSGAFFITMSILIRSVQGVSIAAFYTTTIAVLINRFNNNITTVLGIMETIGMFGFSIGPVVGGLFYQLGGYQTPFFVIGGLTLLVGVCTVGLILTSESQVNTPHREKSIVHLLRHPLVLLGVLSLLTGGISTTFLDPLLTKHLEKFKLPAHLLGLMFTIRPAFYPLMALLCGYLSDRGLYMVLVILGHLMCGLAFLFIGPTPLLPFIPYELWTIITGLVIFGLFFCCTFVPNLKLIHTGALEIEFKDNEVTNGMISGLYISAGGIGDFVGPSFGAIMVDQIDFSWSATVISLMNMLVMVFSVMYLTLRRIKLGGNHTN